MLLLQGNLGLARAFWVTADQLAWNLPPGDSPAAYTLFASRGAQLTLSAEGVQGEAHSFQHMLPTCAYNCGSVNMRA